MALKIKSIPVVEGESAINFLEKAKEVEVETKQDFSYQIDIARKIIEKSNNRK